MVDCMIYKQCLSENTINNINKLAIYLNRLKVNDAIYYDIDKLNNNNKIKKLREIFNIDCNIPIQIAHMFFYLALKYDCDNIMDYLCYFIDMKHIKFCWHHLQKKSNWKKSESLRYNINNKILQTCPVFSKKTMFMGCHYGDGCICDEIKYTSPYSLLECLVMSTNYIDYVYNYDMILDNINNDIDDYIDWNVPFIEEHDSYYPLSVFKYNLETSFRSRVSNKKLDDIIKKVDILF